MFAYFVKTFEKYLIENTESYLIFLIPGKDLLDIFDWYGTKRGEAFSLYSEKIINDIEKRDISFTHMIIWDKHTMELVAGQRFLFKDEENFSNQKCSYIEHYHPGLYQKLHDKSFCEIGRTFVMPKYQNKKVLKELIRGFVRIPEAKNINIGLGLISFNHKQLKPKAIKTFLKILELSKENPLDLPKGKFLYDNYQKENTLRSKYELNFKNLKKIESEIQTIDNKFKLPEVLSPYLRFCKISYENYSIAAEYNGIIQLLFSGRSENINDFQRKHLKVYKNLDNVFKLNKN